MHHFLRKTVKKKLSLVLMASIAVLLSLAKVEIPFPLVPFLKFDLAEVPSILTLLIFGFKEALIVSIIHFSILLFVGSFTPIGPLMKWIAVVSTILGAFLVRRKHVEVLSAMVVRSVFMVILNIVVLLTIFPGLLFYPLEVMCVFVALFNSLHVLLDYFLSYPLYIRLRELIEETKI